MRPSATKRVLARTRRCRQATLRKTVLPAIYYLLVVGVLGLVAVHWIGVTDPLMGSG